MLKKFLIGGAITLVGTFIGAVIHEMRIEAEEKSDKMRRASEGGTLVEYGYDYESCLQEIHAKWGSEIEITSKSEDHDHYMFCIEYVLKKEHPVRQVWFKRLLAVDVDAAMKLYDQMKAEEAKAAKETTENDRCTNS